MNKMVNWLSNMVCWLVLVVSIAVFGIFAGCQQEYREDEPPYEPLLDPNFIVPDYASRAIEATGGRQAWTKAGELEFDCVVTIYRPDGSFYLTEHNYQIRPASYSIWISATEPQGKVVCQSSPDKFGVVEGDHRLYSLPTGLRTRLFAEMILDITTAPVCFLDASFEFTETSGQVKKEGLWYYPIERMSRGVGLVKSYSKSVFYQNSNSFLVDMLWFTMPDEENFFIVRGYDYSEVEKKSVLVPTKIEIFKSSARGILQERLVKIDCHALKSTE